MTNEKKLTCPHCHCTVEDVVSLNARKTKAAICVACYNLLIVQHHRARKLTASEIESLCAQKQLQSIVHSLLHHQFLNRVDSCLMAVQ